MESKELIEIASRIKHKWHPGDCDDAYRLALHVLANVREDDGEAVTRLEISEALNRISDDSIRWHSVYKAKGLLHVDLECTVQITTRGQLRRLLEVLGGGA